MFVGSVVLCGTRSLMLGHLGPSRFLKPSIAASAVEGHKLKDAPEALLDLHQRVLALLHAGRHRGDWVGIDFGVDIQKPVCADGLKCRRICYLPWRRRVGAWWDSEQSSQAELDAVGPPTVGLLDQVRFEPNSATIRQGGKGGEHHSAQRT